MYIVNNISRKCKSTQALLKNDPNLIIKFLLCCRDNRTEWISFSKARMPDLAANDTIDTVRDVDKDFV